jgi:hypothetical protein
LFQIKEPKEPLKQSLTRANATPIAMSELKQVIHRHFQRRDEMKLFICFAMKNQKMQP